MLLAWYLFGCASSEHDLVEDHVTKNENYVIIAPRMLYSDYVNDYLSAREKIP